MHLIKMNQNRSYRSIITVMVLLFFSSCGTKWEEPSWRFDIPEFASKFVVSADTSKLLVMYPTKASILEIPTGQELTSFDISPVHLENIAWSQDETEILTLGKDGRLNIWDVATGQLKATLLLNTFTYSYATIQYAPNSKNYILVFNSFSSSSNTPKEKVLNPIVGLWDLSQGKVLYEFPWTRQAVFSPDGATLLLVGHYDHRIRIWSLSQKKFIAQMGDKEILAAFSGDGTKVITLMRQDFDDLNAPLTINVWDIQNGKLLFQRDLEGLFTSEGNLEAQGFSLNGKYFYSKNRDLKSQSIFEIALGQGPMGDLELIKRLSAPTSSLVFSPDERWVCGEEPGNQTSGFKLWSIQTLKSWYLSLSVGIDYRAFSKDGKWIIIGDGNRHIFGYELSRFP